MIPNLFLSGVKIVVSPHLRPEWRNQQFKFPRSKKRRIRNKWRRDAKNYKLVLHDPCFIINSDTILVSQETYDKINQAL